MDVILTTTSGWSLHVSFVIRWGDECALQPCKNGGTCFDMGDKYFCACPKCFKGNQCEIDVTKKLQSAVDTKNADCGSDPFCNKNVCQK